MAEPVTATRGPSVTKRLRLFFALWPDDDLRRQIVEATRPCVESAGGRAVPGDNLHITLAFLGTVEAAAVPCIDRAATAIDVPAFELNLGQLGYWPRSGVLWLAPSRTPPELRELVGRLWDGLSKCGIAPDSRPYRPHMTLARRAKLPGRLDQPDPLRWRIKEVALIKSDTTPGNATYRVSKTWSLG